MTAVTQKRLEATWEQNHKYNDNNYREMSYQGSCIMGWIKYNNATRATLFCKLDILLPIFYV